MIGEIMGSKGPTVSVIVSAHNRPEYLMEALRSLEGQTAFLDEFEVIVVKDYEIDLSKIDTGNMTTTFIDISDTDLVSKHIAGIEASHGDYIALMDDDDLFSSNKIKRILSLSQHMDGRSFYINGKQFFSNVLEDFSVLSSISNSSFEIFDNTCFHSRRLNRYTPWYNLSSMTIGRELAIKGVDIIRDFRRDIDALWYLIALEFADKIIYDESPLTFYRRHSGGLSRSNNNEKICNYAEQALESYDRMTNIFKKKVTLDTLKVLRAEWQAKARIVGCNKLYNDLGETMMILLKSLINRSLKDVLKILMLLFISQINTKISSDLYPKFYM